MADPKTSGPDPAWLLRVADEALTRCEIVEPDPIPDEYRAEAAKAVEAVLSHLERPSAEKLSARLARLPALDQEGTQVQQGAGGVQRWTISDVPGGVEEDSLGGLVKYSDHLDALQEVEADRDIQKMVAGEGSEVIADLRASLEAAEARALSAEAEKEARADLAAFEDHGDYEAPIESLRRILAALSNHEGRETCNGSGMLAVGVNRDFDSGALEADDERSCPGCPSCTPQQDPPVSGGGGVEEAGRIIETLLTLARAEREKAERAGIREQVRRIYVNRQEALEQAVEHVRASFAPTEHSSGVDLNDQEGEQ